MIVHNQTVKEIKDNLGRAKSYLNRHEPLKAIANTCEAIKLFLQHRVIGQNRIEIEALLAEVLQIMRQNQMITQYLNTDIGFVKGKEKKVYNQLVEVIKNIAADLKNSQNETKEVDNKELHKKKTLEKMQSLLMDHDNYNAASYLKNALQEYGDYKGFFSEISNIYYQAGRYQEAIRFAEKALQRDPKDLFAYRIAMNSYRVLKKYDLSEGIFYRALKNFGEHSNIFFNLSRLYYEWGKLNPALDAAKKAKRLDPENKDIVKIYDFLENKLQEKN